MKTLIYGAGPIGRYYAAQLYLAGKNVTILARGKAYSFLKENGVVLIDGYSGEKKCVHVKTVNKLDLHDDYDLVLVVMNKKGRREVAPALAQNENIKHIIFVGNDVSGFEKYSKILPPEKVLLGFPGLGGGIVNNELIYVDREKPNAKRNPFYLGELDGKIGERTKRIKKLFERAEIPVKLVNDMDGWLKYHVAFIAPVAGVYFMCNQDFNAIQKDKAALETYVRATKEAGKVLKKAGYPKRQPFIFNLYYWNPLWLSVRIFRDKFFGSRFVKIGVGLHANAMGDELMELVNEFRELQAKTTVKTPNLDKLISHIPGAKPSETPARKPEKLKDVK